MPRKQTLSQQLQKMTAGRDDYYKLYTATDNAKRDILKRNEELSRDLDAARRDTQWHKQLNQSLAEAVCAHLRNR